MKKFRKLQDKIRKFLRKLFWRAVPTWACANGGIVPDSAVARLQNSGCLGCIPVSARTIKIINVLDPIVMQKYLVTPDGEKRILDAIKKSSEFVKAIRHSR